ncbi:MAG: hypothetical protein AW10_04223 [Candidatus Accumulibacter appositus]|uniref:Uncharacterized protein n=1 Tax=Candidatus Accumulibacter appositus TaxID=1454003 RepID=A0A011NI80_9PROT|nr:MAG: hypothetical protein AW10_04223 [Candidatus Accumulibacter appositus]
MISMSAQSASGISSTSEAISESVRMRLSGSNSSDSSSMRSKRKVMALESALHCATNKSR